MFQVLQNYGRTDSAGIQFLTVPAATATPAGKVALLIGQTEPAGVHAGEKLKRLEDAVEIILARVHNVSKGQVAVRVEITGAHHAETTFHNAQGLTSDALDAAAFNLADADMAQSTQLLAGCYKQLLEVARETMNNGGATSITP